MKITSITVSMKAKVGMPGYSSLEQFTSITAEVDSEVESIPACIQALREMARQQLALEFGELLEARVDVAFAQNEDVKKKWMEKQASLSETYAAIFPELQGLWRNDKTELNKLRLTGE